jgi:hypothetical protein
LPRRWVALSELIDGLGTVQDIIVSKMETGTEIKKVWSKARLGEQEPDSVYWRTQSYEARLAALEQIRQEYHAWRYGAEPRLQRGYRIAKLNGVR